ncbi:hypothetical protein WA158_003751 [Blastocystis sp. Blastoise]
MLSSCFKTSVEPFKRFFASQGIFDRELKRIHRDTIAKKDDMNEYEYMKNDIVDDLLDRLSDMKKDFPVAVDLSCSSGRIFQQLKGRGNIKTLYQCDTSLEMLKLARKNNLSVDTKLKTEYIQIDDDFLPFKNNSINCVFSVLNIHWISDIYRCMKPDSLFLGCVFGGATLKELRRCLEVAEMAETKCLSQHTSPLLQPSDLSTILQESGFVGATVDASTITAEYRDIYQLMNHLRMMGENNACIHRKEYIPKKVFNKAGQLYLEKFGTPQKTITATFNPIYLTGWKPDPNRKVLSPQTPTKSLNELLNEETQVKS